MRIASVGLVAAALLTPPGVFGDPAAGAAPTLELGLQQLRSGAAAEAVVTLDAVITELTRQATPRRGELADAFIYKGWALLDLDQNAGAEASFRAALQQDPKRRLSADRYPHYVVQAFETVRRAAAMRGFWDPVKIAMTGAVVVVGAATAIQAAEPVPGPGTPFRDFFRGYSIIYSPLGDDPACVTSTPTTAFLNLKGNSVDGSGFAVDVIWVRRQTLSSFTAPGHIRTDGTFEARANDFDITGQVRAGLTVGSMVVNGVLTAGSCRYEFSSGS